MEHLKIYIGKNKSGKSSFLKNGSENKKNVLYFPAEIDVNELMKPYLGTQKKPIYGPQQIFLDFINELYGAISKTRISNKELEKIKNGIEQYNSIKQKINSKNDPYWEKDLLDIIKINEPTKAISDIYHFLSLEKIKNMDLASSGSKHYSLLKIIYELIKEYSLIDVVKNKLGDFSLKFDEPEKFCHPELISKIADIIFEISKIIKVEVVTHSSVFLNKILKHDLLMEENYVEYSYFYQTEEYLDNFKPIVLNLKNILKNENSRSINLIVQSLFSSNLILVEGLIDEIFINSIYESKFMDEYLTIIDCTGIKNVKKIAKKLIDLGITEHINICAFYDRDGDANLNIDKTKIYEIIMEPDLEGHFFEACDDKEHYFIKNSVPYKKKNLLTFVKKVSKLRECSTKKDINEILEKFSEEFDTWINQKWK